MGSTFVDFKHQGFEANDATLEVWLALLVDEIDKDDQAPHWLREAREEWEIQATGRLGFGVVPGLDAVVTDDARGRTVIALAERALRRLRAMGDPIPRAALNGIRHWGDGYEFQGDVDATQFVRPAEYFIKLLDGTLTPEESDARFPA